MITVRDSSITKERDMMLYEELKTFIDLGVNPSEAQGEHMLALLTEEVDCAERVGDYRSKLSLNRSLYILYKLYWCSSSYSNDVLEQSVILFNIRISIERYLQRFSDRQIDKSQLVNIPENNAEFLEYLDEVISEHPAYDHYIYRQFLPRECSLEQLQYYFVQETTMDINTDDFLALLQLGCERDVKTEIARNYWDEMGHGKYEKMHGLLFENLFTYLGTSPEVNIEDITLEALECGNLQLLVSLYRQYFGFGAGFFYPCEHMASGRFASAIEAWKRLELNSKGLVYHKLHVPLDVIHAKNWMDKVLVPYLNIHPNRKVDLLKGTLYRLNSSQRYLDMLMKHWNIRQFNAMAV